MIIQIDSAVTTKKCSTGEHMFKLLTVTFLLILSMTSSWAQSASQLEAQLGKGDKKNAKNWGLSLSSTTVSSVKEVDAYGSTLNTSLSTTFRYKTPYFNTRLFLAADKDLVGAREDRLSSAFFEISKTVSFLTNSNFLTIFQGRYNFAVNQDRRFEQSYQGGLTAGLLVIAKTPHPDFQAIFITRATKNFHEYKIDRSFNKNTSLSNVNTGIISYAPFSAWEFSLYASFVSYWNYEGAVNDSYYSIGQSVSYSPSAKYNFSIGHESGGYTYGYYGNNLDLSLLDTNSSTLYGTLTLNF